MSWIGLESYGMRKDSLVSSDIINGETCDKMKIYKIKWLTAIVVQWGFKTKTQLQRLSEGYLDLQPPKVDKKKQKDDDNEVEEKDTGIVIKKPQQKLITGIKKQITNLFNFSSRNSSKTKTETEIKSNDSKKYQWSSQILSCRKINIDYTKFRSLEH